MDARKIIRLVAAIVVCQLGGIVGSVFTVSAIPGWYAGLNKPFFNPPAWLFEPAWLTLYTLMGIALFLVWEKGFKEKENRQALQVFGLQLVFNAAWSIIFFGLHAVFIAFIEIIVLWVLILVTIIKFNKVSRKAALLLVPYIAWVSFAAVLNLFIWMLNPI
jgi:tryptophan-rich sensory protein